jgi:hypothetical protein
LPTFWGLNNKPSKQKEKEQQPEPAVSSETSKTRKYGVNQIPEDSHCRERCKPKIVLFLTVIFIAFEFVQPRVSW